MKNPSRNRSPWFELAFTLSIACSLSLGACAEAGVVESDDDGYSDYADDGDADADADASGSGDGTSADSVDWQDETEPNDVPEQAMQVAMGDNMRGVIQDPSNSDFFTVQVEAGKPLHLVVGRPPQGRGRLLAGVINFADDHLRFFEVPLDDTVNIETPVYEAGARVQFFVVSDGDGAGPYAFTVR